MHSVGLIEAWQLWFSGKLPDDSLLWGHTILFWGRLGKGIEFVAALTIVFEIIGSERLRRFGDSLHEGFSLQKAQNLIRYARRWHKAWWRILLFRAGAVYSFKEFEDIEYWRRLVFGVLVSPLFVLCMYRIVTTRRFVLWGIIFVISSLLCSLASAALTVVIVIVFSVLSVIIDWFLIEPVAWFLERPRLDKLIKVGSLVVLGVGFHFDLLAS